MTNNASFQFEIPQHHQSIIKVIGVGGGGSNAVEYMYEQGIKDVEFIVCNTDRQALQSSIVPNKLQIGLHLTEGLGAGADPEVGRNAAIENKEEIRSLLSDSTKMLFITAGMGGGTGTGAAPVIAKIAKDLGILTVGIVTAPFRWEGRKKMRCAGVGIEELKATCDAVLVVLNDKLEEVYPNFGISEAFAKADDVLTNSAKSIAEIVTKKIKVNVDFEDVKKVMKNSKTAVMGSSVLSFQEGKNMALEAGKEAINSPLLNNADISGAEKILITVTHGDDVMVSMGQFGELQNYIVELVGAEVEDEVIFGLGTDPEIPGKVKVTIVATGFKDKDHEQKPVKIELDSFKVPTDNSASYTEKPHMGESIQESTSNNSANDIYVRQVTLFDASIDPIPPKAIDPFPPRAENPAEMPSFQFNNEPSIKFEQKPTVNEEQRRRDAQAEQRKEKLQGLSMNIGPLSDEEIKEKLETPAYKRKNLSLGDTPHSSENEVSRFTLNDDDELLGNNRFLHDNVD